MSSEQLTLFTAEKTEHNQFKDKPVSELLIEFQKIFGFNCPIDSMLSVFMKKKTVDILMLDDKLDRANPDYQSKECTYKGETGISTKEFIKRKYGNEAVKLIEALL